MSPSPTTPWLTSLSCSPSPPNASFLHWLAFFFLSPCPQRLYLSVADLFFLVALAFLAIKIRRRRRDEAHKPLIDRHSSVHRVTAGLYHKISLTFTSLLAISYAALLLFYLTQQHDNSMVFTVVECIFMVLHAFTNLVLAVFIVQEKSRMEIRHPISLRVYWIIAFLLHCLFTASAIARLASSPSSELQTDDIFSVFSFLISAILLACAVVGSTGISVTVVAGVNGRSSVKGVESVTPYATASILSRAMWLWINPLISEGFKSPLKLDDVPLLAPEHRAELRHELFQSDWRESSGKAHPLCTALLRRFWPTLAATGTLALVRVAAIYVGPNLVNKFVDYANGNYTSVYEGYYLCALLLAAKLVEVLCSHQYNFHSQKLGMLVRSSLVTSVYRKGLRLSPSARKQYGAGKVVNHMAIDAQTLGDAALQLHNVWALPLQAVVALMFLFVYLGIAMVASLAAVVLIAVLVMAFMALSRTYQRRLMAKRDERVKSTNEVLGNMRVIRLHAWEDYFLAKIQQLRGAEVESLSKFLHAFNISLVVFSGSSKIMALLSFGTLVALGRQLDAGTVFTAMSLFRQLDDPVRNFSRALLSVVQATVSLGRLEDFLSCAEMEERLVERLAGVEGAAVEVRGGVFAWDDGVEEEAVLKDLNVEIGRGKIAAVVGGVGSGKSSFLSCLLGEMNKISGKVMLRGTTAYVAQTAWIRNATIRDNILFGAPFDERRYREVMRACCLEEDLGMLEFGDRTEIGERGINLSGGQKQRIQLARAVYQDCDVYLLDDVFSAVDAQTGSHIFKECVRGILKDKTIILVTHQVEFLHNVDLILVMKDGRIIQSGRYSELLGSGTEFEVLVAAHANSMELVERSNNMSSSKHKVSDAKDQFMVNHDLSTGNIQATKGSSKLIEEEERELGTVSWDVYKIYATEAWGWWGVVLLLLLTVLTQTSSMIGDFWLTYETSEENAAYFNSGLFISVYAGIAVIAIIFLAVNTFVLTSWGLQTAQIFFHKVLDSVLHAPMSFFDTTPSGRILTRASSDQNALDFLIPISFGAAISVYAVVVSILVVICLVAWPTFIPIIPLAWLNFWYKDYYLKTSRELSRLNSITKAPIIHHFTESVSGVTTIRCFGKEESFAQENVDRVNGNLRTDFHINGSSEWLGFRLELIGSFIVCLSTLLMVFLPSLINPDYVGLSLSYSLTLNSSLFFATWASCTLENAIVSVERLKQFVGIPAEARWKIKDCLPSNWPLQGDIDIKDLKARYRPNTPLVLKGINLHIRGGTKIGIVGRTGSGKSTLIQVLFRVIEPCGGSIIIDGVDISTIGLHDLRSRFSIIPQEPVLFEGTVRSNIDPTGQHCDDEIWKSLECCQLKDVVAESPEKLDTPVISSGDNWSLGQRQLLCLGRIMLKHSRILFMDEATASVDSQTDAEIRKIIRKEFSTCTIITIAHRIPTVMDCDRVLVMDAGLAKEFDSPADLLGRPSLFRELVQEYANRSSEM